MDYSPPGSSVHGILLPGKNTGVGCHFLLQGIFLTQVLNWGLLHCRQMLYQLSYKGSPRQWDGRLTVLSELVSFKQNIEPPSRTHSELGFSSWWLVTSSFWWMDHSSWDGRVSPLFPSPSHALTPKRHPLQLNDECSWEGYYPSYLSLF